MYPIRRLTWIPLILTFIILVPQAVWSQLNGPESVWFDLERSRYIISNTNNGRLLTMDLDGNLDTWFHGLSAPKGICTVGDTLFVADVTRIRAYSISQNESLFSVRIAGSRGLNGITSDGNNLYITDFQMGRVYRADIETLEYNIFASNGIQTPNGIHFDPIENRLLVVSFRANSPIQMISIADSSVSTLTQTQISNMDGITMDDESMVYVSSWAENSVFRFDQQTWESTLAETGFNGPADIEYDPFHQQIIVPNYLGNRIEFIDIEPVVTMQIPFQANYFELISFYIEPEDRDAGILFGEVPGLQIVYQDDGSIFLPPSINTIGEVDLTKGYQIYCSDESELTLDGTSMEQGLQFHIEAGRWNWIGYPFDYERSVEEMFSDHEESLTILMNDEGEIYIPPAINTIGSMIPGMGYYAFSEVGMVFTYPEE